MCDKLKVLIVDDNRDALFLLQRLVGKSDCSIRLCNESSAAVRIAQEFAPHVIFLDIAMPVLDGFEVAEDLHDVDLGQYLLVALTSYDDEAHRRECEATGFDLFLAKPPALEAVARVIEMAKDRFLTSA